MQPPDATSGWDDDDNAEQYARFCRDYPFYSSASQDLVTRARLDASQLAVDLCGGTGITANVMLASMPAGSTVVSVDSAAAMQRAGQRWLTDPRVHWVTGGAEALAGCFSGHADVVICNSAIWKTNTEAVFAAVRRVLIPGGRFVFNVGGGFAGLTRPGPRRTPSLTDLISSIAVRDYGYQPRQHDQRPALTAIILARQLTAAGFTTVTDETITYQGSLEEKRAWLSIPVFARPPGHFTHDQRMAILREAFDRADQTEPVLTRWLVVTAHT